MNILALIIVGLSYFFKRNIWNFLVIFVLVAITGLALFQSATDAGVVDGNWWSGMWQNFATEMIGAIITFALFEMLINANNKQESLVRQMASADNTTVINAVNELRALGYLFDGTLQGVSLSSANLADSDLRDANLAGAHLQNADLRHAQLNNSNLNGADLSHADLTGANLHTAKMNQHTILPDEQQWSSSIDLDKYTQPVSPEPELDSQQVPDLELLPLSTLEHPIQSTRPISHHHRIHRAKQRQK